MSYTFRVIFDGVCAYVPERPFFKKVGGGSGGGSGTNYTGGQQTDGDQAASGNKWCAETDVDSVAILLPDLRRAGLTDHPGLAGAGGSGVSASTVVAQGGGQDCPCESEEPSDEPSDTETGDLGSACRHRRRPFFPEQREPHFPLLRFNLGDLAEGTDRRVDLVCRDISEKDESGLLFLRREQIRFHLKAENARTFTFANWTPWDRCCCDGASCPNNDGGAGCRCEPHCTPCDPADYPLPDLALRDERESLWWLPDLGQIAGTSDPGAAVVDSDFLPSYRGPIQEGLVARVECYGGRLRTYDFNRTADGRPLPWRFAPPGDASNDGTWRRAIGNSLALEFFDVQGPVEIEIKRLANEVVTRKLVLSPHPGACRDVVEIEIGNREPDLLFEQEGLSRAVLPDMDFQAFYRQLSRAVRPIKDLPVPHPSLTYFFGVTEKPCAGTQMRAEEG
jgi:hypothetical protein